MGGNVAAEPVGSIEVALAHAARLLERDPRLAAEQASEILKAVPAHPSATLILGIARRASGDTPASLSVLQPLAQDQPRWAAAHYELGLTLGEYSKLRFHLPESRTPSNKAVHVLEGKAAGMIGKLLSRFLLQQIGDPGADHLVFLDGIGSLPRIDHQRNQPEPSRQARALRGIDTSERICAL